MHFSQRCVFALILLGQLIASVNRDREIENSNANKKRSKKTISKEAETLLSFVLHSTNIHGESDQLLHPVSVFENNKVRSKRSTKFLNQESFNSPSCDPWDSCAGRCGQANHGLPFTCSCDKYCSLFSDCCVDYELKCNVSDHDVYSSTFEMRKQKLKNLITCGSSSDFGYPYYIIDKCPLQDFKNFYNINLNLSANCENLFPNNEADFQQCLNIDYEKCKMEIQLAYNDFKSFFYNDENNCSSTNITQLVNTCLCLMRKSKPVRGTDGMLYYNPFCATCNGQSSYHYIDEKALLSGIHISSNNTLDTNILTSDSLRLCFPTLNTCSIPGLRYLNQSLEELCSSFSSPMWKKSGKHKQGILYKNLFCGLCNGVSVHSIMCPVWSFIPSNSPLLNMMYSSASVTRIVEVNGLIGVQGIKPGDIPAAFSILLNFGLDGRERMMFSSEGEEEMRKHQLRCGQGHIWDPFSKICRKLYCSTEFILVNFRCVKKENNENTTEDENEDDPVIVDVESKFVHLTLSVEIEYLDILTFYGQDADNITDSIKKSLAAAFHISADRLQNVAINISLGNFSNINETLNFINVIDAFHPITFTIDFDLYETAIESNKTEPSVDSIVSMLASSLSINGFDLDIENVRSRIFEIHQTIEALDSWCNPKSGGKQKEYWNSDFTLIFNENKTALNGNYIRALYINKTQKMYYQGQFVANILFQGYQFNGNLINVSGVVVVCEYRNKLNESCARVPLQKHEYVILPNGTLEIVNGSNKINVVDVTSYELFENDSVLVCLLSETAIFLDEGYYLHFDMAQAYVSLVLLCISVFALALVLLTYLLFPDLRNLPGCNTMNLTFSLLAMQITFLLGQRETVTGVWCRTVAKLLHYEILCSFMWMNVMAYDLYNTFGTKTVLNNVRSKKKFLPKYISFAYGSPIIIVLCGVLLDIYYQKSPISPRYGLDDICWITSKYGALVFFAVPLGIIMIVNYTFYVRTIIAIRSIKHVLYARSNSRHRVGQSDVVLYARMAFVTGLTWALVFVAAYVRFDEKVGQIITYLFIILNTLQGVFIFFVFVCNKRVYKMYTNLIKKTLQKQNDEHQQKSNSIFRIFKGMTRSISTNTVVSTVSMSSASGSSLKSIPESPTE